MDVNAGVGPDALTGTFHNWLGSLNRRPRQMRLPVSAVESSASTISRVFAQEVQSRFAETRFAETLTLTLTLNPNFGESAFGESGRHQCATPCLPCIPTV